MGVYIKGMEKPKSCSWGIGADYCECPLLDGMDNCKLQKEHFETWTEQYAGCPLNEVPEPHGDLIDMGDVLDAIEKRLEVLRTHEVFVRKHGEVDLRGVLPYIADIQPVIKGDCDK